MHAVISGVLLLLLVSSGTKCMLGRWQMGISQRFFSLWVFVSFVGVVRCICGTGPGRIISLYVVFSRGLLCRRLYSSTNQDPVSLFKTCVFRNRDIFQVCFSEFDTTTTSGNHLLTVSSGVCLGSRSVSLWRLSLTQFTDLSLSLIAWNVCARGNGRSSLLQGIILEGIILECSSHLLRSGTRF